MLIFEPVHFIAYTIQRQKINKGIIRPQKKIEYKKIFYIKIAPQLSYGVYRRLTVKLIKKLCRTI